jgi:FtsP/CotA-like multicopper oxidase with cupredoxin domain
MPRHSRRTFVTGLTATGAAASLGLLRTPVWAQTPPVITPSRELAGPTIDLRIGETMANLTGRRRVAQTINGSLPGPLLRLTEGEAVTLRVANDLDEDTSIHWHGLILPANMDGVPGLSFSGIHPGETLRLSVHAAAERHLLVPQPLGLPGTARRLWPVDHRAA